MRQFRKAERLRICSRLSEANAEEVGHTKRNVFEFTLAEV